MVWTRTSGRCCSWPTTTRQTERVPDASLLRAESLTTIAADVAAGRRSAVEVAEAALQSIEATSQLNAVIMVDAERALQQAATIDRARAAGEAPGPPAGV